MSEIFKGLYPPLPKHLEAEVDRLERQLAELKARGDAMCRNSWYSNGTKCVYEHDFMEFEAALNNDKDRVGE